MDSIRSWPLEQLPDYEKKIHEPGSTDMAFQVASHELQRELAMLIGGKVR